MDRRMIRRIVCAGLALLLVFFVLTTLGHMMCCHEGEEQCPVCMALLKSRNVWTLCLLCFLLRFAGKALNFSCCQAFVLFRETRCRADMPTPVSLNVKMNN